MNWVLIAAVLSTIYANPQRVEIEGFSADAQEPCISLDGRTLFWSGKNDSDATAHIYWAKRTGDLRFKYMGRLDKLVTKAREMAPSVDSAARMYFTSTEKFGETHRTICTSVPPYTSALAVLGDISDGCGVEMLGLQFTLNMDCGVSPDGGALVISRAHFVRGETMPRTSKLFIARKQPDGSFRRDPKSDVVLAEVNEGPLQYAPAISADGLELYFTRATPGQVSSMQTMVATRKTVNEAFGKPVRLEAIQGFVEAPSITFDRRELYVHRLDPAAKRFFIYRLTHYDKR